MFSSFAKESLKRYVSIHLECAFSCGIFQNKYNRESFKVVIDTYNLVTEFANLFSLSISVV